MCMCVCVCVGVCVCGGVSVCEYMIIMVQNNGSIHLKLEHIVVYENSRKVRHWALSDQGQGHSVT